VSHGGDAAEVTGGGSFTGTLRVPGDKSISHRALLLGALAEGTSTVEGLSTGEDVAATARAVAALGAEVQREEGSGRVVVSGGRGRLRPPGSPLDLGNSGTGLRLLAGLVATLAGPTTLTGDASLRTRPMDRVAEPLGRMGAELRGQGPRCLPPVTVVGGPLVGIDYTTPVASAQVKSAVLLAGLAADGETIVREAVRTRAHTEEMLARAGARLSVTEEESGRVVRLQPSELRPVDTRVPGDPSQAAFWLVGALVAPDSTVTVEDVELGAERTGFLEVLRRMGARLEVAASSDGVGRITARTSELSATEVEAAEIPSLDEVPVLAVAAARARGLTRFRQMGELRVKESDRLAGTAAVLTAFGVEVRVEGDDLLVTGRPGPLEPARVDALDDHRLAMAAAVAAAAGTGGGQRSTIVGWDAVATSYPGFLQALAALRHDGGGR
jgi:3-phosphoshikimate 1-carboxyvinyltransferase